MGKIHQRGAVSIFAVIFATLLFTVLTVGFISLMISAQQRAINNDLSQSAYDAAMAGVEDAKRVIRRCNSGEETACRALEADDDCRVVARAEVNGNVADDETVIASGLDEGSGEQFNQAYTCVNIRMNTEDYLYDAVEGASHLVPLRSTQDIKSIVIEWYMRGNSQVATAPTAASINGHLPVLSGWSSTAPPLLRAQLITPGESFSLSSLDGSSASATFFFRPSLMSLNGTTGSVEVGEGSYPRATTDGEINNGLRQVTCSSGFRSSGAYSCRVQIDFPDDRLISVLASNNAMLRLETVYGAASVRVSLVAPDGSVAQFNGVQPSVDSTGRASDLFRRVDARLDMAGGVTPPSSVVDLRNSASGLCKDFSVTDVSVVSGSCRP